MKSHVSDGVRRTRGLLAFLGTLLLLAMASGAWAAVPVVKTVPWVASNPLIPHDTWNGKTITLKGACAQCLNYNYSWDAGDGSAPVTGTVTNPQVIEVKHSYNAPVGTVFTARLTVTDPATGDSASRPYYVQVQSQALPVEVNVAIDEGLWYLHKTMRRFDISGQAAGDWVESTSCGSPSFLRCASSTPYFAITPSNLSAFFVNGHLETGDASNPYTETVQRAMKGTLNRLQITPVTGTKTNPVGTFNPDHNGNNVGVTVPQSYPFYQGGLFMDAIVASGTPNAPVTVAPFAGRTDGTGPGGAWRYFDVVQDMVDYHAFCQYSLGTRTNQPPGTPDPAASGGGGWRYSCNQAPDGSVVQFPVIGMKAAERVWGVAVSPIMKEWLRTWTDTAHNHLTGISGYTSTSPIWGPYATTAAGTVQMAWSGYGRGTVMWDSSENFFRSNFCNAGGATTNIRNYYYGLFSFTKSMLLHDTNADGLPEPIDTLECRGDNACALAPIDWYLAEAAAGAQCDGVARTLVNAQNAAGAWFNNNYTSTQYPYETGWAIVMLNRTVFASGLPVAVAQAVPNPVVAFQTVNLNGSGSFHQDASKTIVSWAWDLNNNGQYTDATGPTATVSFPALGNYPVGLRVCDNGSPQECASTIVTVQVSLPPLAPTANAGGPYNFCPQAQPWFLDGTGSVNPDEGLSEPGLPGDTIQSYAWELDGDGLFDDALGAQPDVTAFFSNLGVGEYLISLRVTDTTATSFPSSGLGNLSGLGSAQVRVRSVDDPVCTTCVDNLAARVKDGKVQLTWTHIGAPSYNVYRSATAGGPFAYLATTTSTYSTYLDETTVTGTTYHYVVRPRTIAGVETCQSNEVSGTPTARVRGR
jgi:hypothetical protein